MLEAGLAAQAIFPGVEWGDIVLRPPNVTFIVARHHFLATLLRSFSGSDIVAPP